MEVSWIDIGIAIILLISVGVAMFRGFVREAISLASWVAAIWLAMTFSNQVALFLPASIDEATFNLGANELEVSRLRVGIAFLLIVIGTLIAGALLNYILSQVTQSRALRGIDRVLGMFFGLARGAAVVVIIILVAALTSFPSSDTWQSSRLLPPFELAARKVIDLMPEEFLKYFTFDEAELQASSFQLKFH